MFAKSKLPILLLLLAFISFFYLLLIMQHRLPIAHDTGQYLEQQYVYFNEMAQGHTFPLWFPFIKQGYVGNYHFTSQLTILAPVTYLVALMAKGVNYLYLFFAGLWLDEIFMMLGVVLLGSLFFQRRTTLLFVGLTAFASTVWYPQIFWGMHLYYFIPMVLFCFHQFLNEQKMRYLAGALLAFWLGFVGNGLYINIFVSFVLLVYVGAVFLFSVDARHALISGLGKVRPAGVGGVLALLVIMGLSLCYVKLADGQIAFLGAGRTAGNGVTLDIFMQYGGGINIAKYLSFFDRTNTRFLTPDLQLYAGFAMPFLTIIGLLFGRQKERWPLVIATVTVILFSSATFVSVLFYHIYPLGQVFRHIGLTATVAKLFMIILAGFGLDVMLNYLKAGQHRVWLLWSGLFILFVFLCRGLSVLGNDPLAVLSDKEGMLLSMGRYILLTGVLAAGVMAWRGMKYRYKALIALFMAVVMLELFAYKYSKVVAAMPRASAKVIALFQPSAYQFTIFRPFSTMDQLTKSERMKTLWPLLEQESKAGRLWSVYDTLESFLFTDTFQSNLRSDYALVPVKDFLAAASTAPAQVQAQVYLRYGGVFASKVGVFSQLNYAADASELAKIFARTGHNADSLWTTADQVSKVTDPMDRRLVLNDPASTGESVPARVAVKKFEFNEIILDVDVAGPAGRSYFLYYADAYHPFWKARVNGEGRPVLRANIGYKAVVIPAGRSEVVFYFGHPLYYVAVMCAMLLCGGVIVGTVYLCRLYLIRDRLRV
ncbi:MAG: hypothetical protein HQL17_03585 [Candidatus Omnitrophica bacterium]|nr:hypothetical protein [Candidatus Omnitrophota bacterium]